MNTPAKAEYALPRPLTLISRANQLGISVYLTYFSPFDHYPAVDGVFSDSACRWSPRIQIDCGASWLSSLSLAPNHSQLLAKGLRRRTIFLKIWNISGLLRSLLSRSQSDISQRYKRPSRRHLFASHHPQPISNPLSLLFIQQYLPDKPIATMVSIILSGLAIILAGAHSVNAAPQAMRRSTPELSLTAQLQLADT